MNIKKILFTALIFAVLISSGFVMVLSYKAVETIEVTLKDNEVYKLNNLHPYFIPTYYGKTNWSFEDLEYNGLVNATSFINPDSCKLRSSAIMRSMETQNNNTLDLICYANRIALDKNLGYYNILNKESTIISDGYAFVGEGNDYQKYINKYENFRTYYHQLFRSSGVRKLLFKEALDWLVKYASKAPKNFRLSLIQEFDQLLIFSKTLPMTTYNEFRVFNDYWEGFIYRRFFNDKIPLTEIQEDLTEARNKISSTKSNIDYIHEIKVNNEILVYLGDKSFTVKSKINDKEVSINETLTSIRYFEDNTGSYYQFLMAGVDSSDETQILFDSKLNRI